MKKTKEFSHTLCEKTHEISHTLRKKLMKLFALYLRQQFDS